MLWYVIADNVLCINGPSGTWYCDLTTIADPDVAVAVAHRAARTVSRQEDEDEVLRIFQRAIQCQLEPMRSNP